jgi:signal transduction histidine kinase
MENKEILNSGFYYIKPAANHILTVGKGIIKDSYTAILELVKNAYDADAENVTITIELNAANLRIIIEDDGHGMSFKTVTEKWMVPSTADKRRLKKSLYKKRPLQGRKGIGRYAASILGSDMLLKTTEKESGTTTELLINWVDFLSDQKFLEDVDILIENYIKKGSHPGTSINITGDRIWTDKELDELISSLRRLLSPFDEIDSDFRIFLLIKKEGSEKYGSYSEQVKPLPILEYYHYRISGNIKLLGICAEKRDALIASLTLENKYLQNILPSHIEKEIILEEGEETCGDLDIDIRAFDLDEGPLLKDQKISVDEAKKQLKELPGIAVIREGFRVRPYGDKKVDWLGLNERRYNNPTLRLSSNQVAGFVSVLQEDESHLEEKATREGFKEDSHYEGLKQCILQSLVLIEGLRFRFRRQHNKGNKKQKTLSEHIQDASNLANLNSKITSILSNSNISEETSAQLKQAIDEEAKEKEKQFEEIRNIIAKYEGQVTLGKIMTVVLHEGRKPLNALKQHPKFISEWSSEYLSLLKENYSHDDSALKALSDKILDRLHDNKHQTEIFISIFKKLEPLANSKRAAAKNFKLSKPIQDAFKLFEVELVAKNILYSITGDLSVDYKGWEVDFYIAFANLIENSVHWLSQSNEKNILVNITSENDAILIDYSDTGTGIDEENIENQDIFEPGFSTKSEGTGLGLSIAGEALERNGGKIKAVSNPTGANFIIDLNKTK